MMEVLFVKILSVLEDNRINAKNILIDIEIRDYLPIARDIIARNEFQRNRVKRSVTIYSLLKKDLNQGCIIPAIILALSNNDDCLTIATDLLRVGDVEASILLNIKENLLILDGVQRTYTMMDLESELKKNGDIQALEKFYGRTIRIELYVGINRLGILYRMLTLNTGQTPMSLRHQIEMMYMDYFEKDIEGISLVRDVDEEKIEDLGQYRFRDILDGFNSYLERNELALDRVDLLENIKGLELLAKENQNIDLFKEFLLSYHEFVSRMKEITDEWEFDADEVEYRMIGEPFAKDVIKIFNKPQAMTGFGAAIGKLVDLGIMPGFAALRNNILEINSTDEHKVAYNNLIVKLDMIRGKAKKIGNSQRMFFQYFFRELFNSEGDSFLRINDAIENAYKKYQSQVE